MFKKAAPKIPHVMGIDIGSNQIKVALCEWQPNGLILKGVGASISAGIEKGQIRDLSALESSVQRAIQRATLSAGTPCTHVVSNFPLNQVDCVQGTAIVHSRSKSGKIQHEDKVLAIKKAEKGINTAGQVVLHAIPVQYRVDGVEVDDITDIEGSDLEVDTTFILANEDTATAIRQLYQNLGLTLHSMVYDGLALSKALSSYEDLQNGVSIVDMGGQFTKITTYHGGHLSNIGILPYGGNTITSDISICLKSTVPEAERVKIIRGTVAVDEVSESEELQIMTQKGTQTIKRKFLAQIIDARVDELCHMFLQQMAESFEQSQKIILAGQAAQLQGLVTKIEALTQTPTQIGDLDAERYAQEAGLSSAYALALGVLEYANDISELHVRINSSNEKNKKPIKKLFAIFS